MPYFEQHPLGSLHNTLLATQEILNTGWLSKYKGSLGQRIIKFTNKSNTHCTLEQCAQNIFNILRCENCTLCTVSKTTLQPYKGKDPDSYYMSENILTSMDWEALENRRRKKVLQFSFQRQKLNKLQLLARTNFHQLGPLGQVGLVVAMSVCL